MKKILALLIGGTAITTLAVVLAVKNQAPPAPPPDPTVKKILQLDLTESIVSRMEAQPKLAKQAQAKRESRGWRMIKVDPDSLFAQAGLKEGDLITTEFLNKVKTTDKQMQLMLRVQQILNRITR